MSTTPESVADARAGESWDAAVAEASRHVAERGEAERAAAEQQRPRSQAPKTAAALVALTAVLAWNAYAWTRPPEPMAPERERAHLAYVAIDVVETIEDFRIDNGRVPTAEEVVELLGEDVEYHAREDGFQVVVTGESGSLTYDGSIPAHDWAEIQAGDAAAEPQESGS